MTEADAWVLVQNCTAVHEAYLVRAVLEGSGIECFLPDEHTVGIRPELALALGGVRVLVRARDLPRAREVLSLAEPPVDDEPGSRRR